MHQRTELGREVMLFEDIDKDKLTALGDVRPPVIADLFMAINKSAITGGLTSPSAVSLSLSMSSKSITSLPNSVL